MLLGWSEKWEEWRKMHRFLKMMGTSKKMSEC
jgi:hypothetical protein